MEKILYMYIYRVYYNEGAESGLYSDIPDTLSVQCLYRKSAQRMIAVAA